MSLYYKQIQGKADPGSNILSSNKIIKKISIQAEPGKQLGIAFLVKKENEDKFDLTEERLFVIGKTGMLEFNDINVRIGLLNLSHNEYSEKEKEFDIPYIIDYVYED